MRVVTEKTPFMRFAALVAIFALVAACAAPAASPSGEASEAPGSEPPSTASEAPAGGDLGTYTLGIFQDMTTDNWWNYYDSEGGTVWNQYVLAPTGGSLYTITMPGIERAPVLAADAEMPEAVQEGDVWVAEVALRDGITWSDGEPITANDFAFTFNTAVEFQLTDSWQDVTDQDIVTAVEAADDTTVRVTFNAQPGLAIWGPGTGVGDMPVQPEHFWADIVDAARGTEDPRTSLLAESGAEAPSAGATVFSEWQEGSFAATSANPEYYDQGVEFTSGGVTWTEGPYATDFQFPLYGGQEAAVLALADGEVDYLLNPLGMQRGFRAQVEENPDLTAIVNPTNGYRYLAFNHARAPMSDAAFRDALTALINKEYVTEQLLQGVAFPLYVILPEGNTAWYNEEVAGELATAGYAGLEDGERRQIAFDLLTEAGYAWETAPVLAEDGSIDTPGSGLIGPDGVVVEQLELLTPTPGYDPLRATFGNYISGVAQEMGIPVVSIPTDFNKIVDTVFATDPNDPTIYTSPFDMYILGYSLGNAAFPTFHGSFFQCGGDSNNTQYCSEEYDAFSATFDAALTNDEAFEAMWEMERLIAADKPHTPLFDTGILEFYNNRVQYPFTETL
ncbi:MAG: ABC transporter substrate-binding protein, partial [Candidatus Limnocylindria bacterium]